MRYASLETRASGPQGALRKGKGTMISFHFLLSSAPHPLLISEKSKNKMRSAQDSLSPAGFQCQDPLLGPEVLPFEPLG